MNKEDVIKFGKFLQSGYIIIVRDEKEKKELFEKLNKGEIKHIVRMGEV